MRQREDRSERTRLKWSQGSGDEETGSITGRIGCENFFSMRRVGGALLGWLLVAYILRDTDFGYWVALGAAIVYFLLRATLNDSPLNCPYCGKAVKWDATSCHHCGRVVNRVELLSERIGKLRGEKQALEEALAEVGTEREEAEGDELAKQLARVPDLTKALTQATPEIQRQVFQAFELRILCDKAERRIEILATVSEAVANAFEKQKALPKEGSLVVLREVAGARFVSRYHCARIREIARHPR